MEVNYLLITVTTAIACCFIFFLTWKNRRDAQNDEREKIKSEMDLEAHKNEGLKK
jgi:hypothetical protein